MWQDGESKERSGMLAVYHPWSEELRMHSPSCFLSGVIIARGDPSAKQKDLDTYIDLSLKNWGWMSQKEFHQWERQKKAGIKKLKEEGQTQLIKYNEPWIRRETLSHHEDIKRLTLMRRQDGRRLWMFRQERKSNNTCHSSGNR